MKKDKTMKRQIGRLLISGIVVTAMGGLLSGNVFAQEAGNAARGALLAQTWCASCHIIDNAGTGQSVEAARPFPNMAKDPTRDADFYRHWLTTRHPQMPNLDLGRRNINDLVAYIRTLAPAR